MSSGVSAGRTEARVKNNSKHLRGVRNSFFLVVDPMGVATDASSDFFLLNTGNEASSDFFLETDNVSPDALRGCSRDLGGEGRNRH